MNNPAAPYKMPSLVSKTVYFPALTGVRAVAAFLVFLSHFNPFDEQVPSQRWAFTFVHQGHFGVPIFFVLSGFLIATRYMNRVEPTWSWLRVYIKNRIARIYPLYFVLTAATFLIYQINPTYDFLGTWDKYSALDRLVLIILNFTFLRGFFANCFFSGISQGWSLTAEEVFYILAPLIFLTMKSNRLKPLLIWSVSLIGSGALLVFIFSPYANVLLGFFGSLEFMFQWTFFGHTLEFMMGIGLAVFTSKESQHYKKGSSMTYVGAIWIALCAAFVATVEQYLNPIYHPDVKILAINFLLPPGICIFFYGLLKELTFVGKILATRLFDLLGKSSYAFYLVHLGVLSVALNKVGSPVLLSLCITILVSILLFKMIEEPLHKYIKKNQVKVINYLILY